MLIWKLWIGLVLWHINHYWLFNAKYCLYIYIKYIWLVWFYGISTIIGYLMPNTVYTCILNIYDWFWFYGISTSIGYLIPNIVHTYILNIYMIFNHLFLITFLNEPELFFFLHKVKWFQVFLCSNNNLTSVICLHISK